VARLPVGTRLAGRPTMTVSTKAVGNRSASAKSTTSATAAAKAGWTPRRRRHPRRRSSGPATPRNGGAPSGKAVGRTASAGVRSGLARWGAPRPLASEPGLRVGSRSSATPPKYNWQKRWRLPACTEECASASRPGACVAVSAVPEVHAASVRPDGRSLGRPRTESQRPGRVSTPLGAPLRGTLPAACGADAPPRTVTALMTPKVGAGVVSERTGQQLRVVAFRQCSVLPPGKGWAAAGSWRSARVGVVAGAAHAPSLIRWRRTSRAACCGRGRHRNRVCDS
jgi:hypothetical protein